MRTGWCALVRTPVQRLRRCRSLEQPRVELCPLQRFRMAPKEKRKGKKEIHKSNIETLKFYRKFSLIGSAIQIGHFLLFYFLLNTFSWWSVIFLIFAVGVHLASHLMLQKLFQPYISPEGVLLEAGTDLNDSYFSEYTIDIIILTAGIQALSAISNWFWLLWLLAPGYIFYKIWTLLIWPWFTAGGPNGGEEKEGKKQKQKHKKVYMR